MSRPVPRIRGFSVVVPTGAHVDPYDALLLARVFGAQPNLAAFLWSAGLTREESERVMALVEAFGDLGNEWAQNGAKQSVRPATAVEEISSTEAALRLTLTPQRVGQLVREGRLAGRLQGRRLLVKRASVEQYRTQRARAVASA